MSRFEGKVCVITGGSAGIGLEAARLFAAEGAKVVLAARGEEKLNAAVAGLQGSGSQAFAVPTDVGDDAACRRLLDTAVERFGGVDVLVNNAGLHHRGPFDRIDAEALGDMVSVNLRAPVVLTRLALPLIQARGGGAIVQVASLAGRVPTPGSAVYSATKFGLRALSLALAEEMRDSGVRFAVVSPGPVSTDFILEELETVSDLTLSQPMSTAREVAQAVVDCAADGRTERALPGRSGLLTTVAYLAPGLGRLLRPRLEKRGARARQRLETEGRPRD